MKTIRSKVTIGSHGADGLHHKGTENLRSLDLHDGPYYIDQVTKGEGREVYCLTYGTKFKPAFQRIDEEGRDTVFFLCDAEKGRFETYILASEVRKALETEQPKITLPGYSPVEVKRFSRECAYPCKSTPRTGGSNTAHVKVPTDFLEMWDLDMEVYVCETGGVDDDTFEVES